MFWALVIREGIENRISVPNCGGVDPRLVYKFFKLRRVPKSPRFYADIRSVLGNANFIAFILGTDLIRMYSSRHG